MKLLNFHFKSIYLSAVLIAIASCLVFASCKNETKPRIPSRVTSANHEAPKRTSHSVPTTDSSLYVFTKSIVDDSTIILLKSMEDGYWIRSEEDSFLIEDDAILRDYLQTYDTLHREGLISNPYDIDSGGIIDFKGSKYAVIDAGYHRCNGTGCLEYFYFIYDFKNRELNVFRVFGAPDYIRFGDIDNDTYPDFLWVKCSGYVHDVSTKEILFRPYRMKNNGSFEIIKHKGKECYIKGGFDNGIFEPRNFTVKEKYWFK